MRRKKESNSSFSRKMDDLKKMSGVPSQIVYPFYPELIETTKSYQDRFIREFSILIEKNLRKKLVRNEHLEELTAKFARKTSVPKKTLIVSLEDCLLLTTLFKEEIPSVDGEFKF